MKISPLMKQTRTGLFILLLGVLPVLTDPLSAAEIRRAGQENEKGPALQLTEEAGSRRVANRYSKMIRDATDAIRQNPGEPTLYLARGWAFYELKKTDEQIADATMAINLNTRNGKAYFLRADGYLRLGRYQNALGDLTRAINLGEADEITHQYRALVFYYLGRFEEAVDLNSRILALNPQAEIPMIDRGLALFCLGHYSEAFSDLGKVIETEGSSILTRKFGRLRRILNGSEGRDFSAERNLLEMIQSLRNSKNPAPGLHYGQCRSLAV